MITVEDLTPIDYMGLDKIDLSCHEGINLKDFLDSHKYLAIIKIGIFGGPDMENSYNCITIMDLERNHIVCDIEEQMPDNDIYNTALIYLKDYVNIICKEK